MQITDRAKDLIKSGGEWISSVELENALMSHPDVMEAAVIAKPDERWTERPLACVVCQEGASPSPEDLRKHLEPLVAKWWLPDEFAFIEAVPKTSVGKFDKKVLRGQLADGALETTGAARPRSPRSRAADAGTIPPALRHGAVRLAAPEPSSIHARDHRHGCRQAGIQAQDPRRRGQARPRRPRPRRQDHRPRPARRRHGGDLHGAAPDSRADRRDRDPGGRRTPSACRSCRAPT